MKKFITFIFLVMILAIVIFYREEIGTSYLKLFSTIDRNVKLEYKNEYYRDTNYDYVKIVDNFNVKNKEDIINTYYTILNSGIDKFTFFCSNEYKNCIDDVKEIANNQEILSNINSFVHPFNSFSSIETKYDSLKRITLKINKSYTKEEIKEINNKIDEIINSKLKNVTDKKEIIKVFHDYVINNSKYDSDKSDKNINNYNSNIAYGPLIQGYGLCGGYTDSMAIFLDRYDIPNFKIISENHIWNAVYLDNEWYHLDLTWDDPVTSDKSDVLEYNFFLITSDELEELATNQHIYDKSVFSELGN